MAVSYDQALNFYKKNRNKFPGMTATQAADQIVRGGEIPVAAVEAAPTAIPVAAPVAAALAAAAPAPAPVPMAAPEPVAEVEDQPEAPPAPVYMNQYENALAAYNLANPNTPAPAAVKGKPVDYADVARRLAADRQRQELEANVEISRTAQIDPDTKKLIDDRLARYGIQLTEADKDRQQATWMAVAQAGMKMAQSQSPYFMQALASGMEAGIDGYSEAKAKAAEKKARLQDAKEELSMKAIELRAQAVKDGIAARQASKQAAAADATLFKDTIGGVVAAETADEVVEAARLGNKLTSAQISQIFNNIKNDNVRVSLARAAATSGGGGGVSTKVINSQVGIIKAQMAANKNEMDDITIPRERKARLAADNDRLRSDLSTLQSVLSGNSGAASNNPLGVSTPWRK
jgi:hypothetical protein